MAGHVSLQTTDRTRLSQQHAARCTDGQSHSRNAMHLFQWFSYSEEKCRRNSSAHAHAPAASSSWRRAARQAACTWRGSHQAPASSARG
eukprot:2184757-Rhodomonas_salina.2